MTNKIDKEKLNSKVEQQNKTTEIKPEDKKDVKNDKDFPYYVILNDAWGTASKQQVKVPVRRFIDKSNVYLYNEKTGFKEEMPEDTETYKQYKIEDLQKKVRDIENKIKSNNNNDSVKDLKEDIRIYKSWLRSLELQGRGSYMNFDTEGKPFFEFDRRGMFKLPVFKNIDISLKYVPDESKIKEGSDLIIENNKANADENLLLKMIPIALTVILGLMVFGFGYLMYQTNTLTGDLGNNLVEITKSISEIGINLNENTNDLINLSKEFNNNVTETPKIEVPVNVIQ